MKNRILLDFHSHILPAIDDGAQHPKQSLEMLFSESKAGITDVCLTPHYYADESSIVTFRERRQNMYVRLCEEMRGRSRRVPRLHLSAEVHYFSGIAEEPYINLLCCGNSNLILIEPPMRKWNDGMFLELSRLKNEQGLQPVIAHLDRYMIMLDDPTLMAKVRSNGFLVQCNISFFLNSASTSLACRLLRSGMIDFVGSDAHNTVDRPVEMTDFLRLLKRERLEESFYALSAKGLYALYGNKRF